MGEGGLAAGQGGTVVAQPVAAQAGQVLGRVQAEGRLVPPALLGQLVQQQLPLVLAGLRAVRGYPPRWGASG
ncbi:hypothetical protein [Streptomyces djakartensis]|uniref:hypothetical protein n=1 Tax=Streptomyces djakartensis TaxID=68193 RepID=UPI0034DF63A9